MGASTDRNKFGNKVLRCYLQNNHNCTPINKKQLEIEGIKCQNTLTEWYNSLVSENKNVENLGISIVTPPGVTKMILEEGLSLGIKNYFLQPGTYDNETKEFLLLQRAGAGFDFNVVKGCVLIDLGFRDN